MSWMVCLLMGEFSCLGVIPLPPSPNEFHEGRCGFRVVFEQTRRVFGRFLTAVYFRGPGGGGVCFSDSCLGFVLGLFSLLGAVLWFLERRVYAFCTLKLVEFLGCRCFGAVLGDFGSLRELERSSFLLKRVVCSCGPGR